LHGHYALWDSTFGWLGPQGSCSVQYFYCVGTTYIVKAHVPRHSTYISTMVADKRKSRDKPPPCQRQQKNRRSIPATSAQPAAARTAARQNLILNDWLTVSGYIDAHPAISQYDIARVNLEEPSGAFIFMQSTLSRKLKTLEARFVIEVTTYCSKT
jgi:hypothetical protein